MASADVPLGQWFSNYFDHDPEKEKTFTGTQYTQDTHNHNLNMIQRRPTLISCDVL